MPRALNSKKKKSIPLSAGKDRLASDHLMQKAFDCSLQANIISNLKTGMIIRANKAACQLIGYSKRELLTKKREEVFLISETSYKTMMKERKAEGFARADVSIMRKGGKLWPCAITSVLFKDDEGVSNSITSIVDRREGLLKQRRIDIENEKTVALNIDLAQSKADISLADNANWINAIARTSYDVTWDWDIVNDLISFGKSYEKVFGIKLSKGKASLGEWLSSFLHEEAITLKMKLDKERYSENMSWESGFEFTCPDGTPGHIIIRGNILRDDKGDAIRMIGVIHDTSKLQKIEELLKQELCLKERQISDAVVEGKEMERSDIGKELHDNVNQLLGASMLYMDMARKDVSNGEIYLIHSSEYTLTAIEEIRKLSKALTTDSIRYFGLSGAIGQVCLDTMESYPIKIQWKANDQLEGAMSVKFKLNVFRIFQEQLSNVLKYAKATVARVTFVKKNTSYILSIIDNGVGFDTTKPSKGIGISNIISRAESFNGKAQFDSAPGKGCKLVVKFPVT